MKLYRASDCATANNAGAWETGLGIVGLSA